MSAQDRSAAPTYEQRVFAMQDSSTAEVAALVRRSVMLSMELTGKYKTRDGQDGYSHDDYDVAMAALNELQRRAQAWRDSAHV